MFFDKPTEYYLWAENVAAYNTFVTMATQWTGYGFDYNVLFVLLDLAHPRGSDEWLDLFTCVRVMELAVLQHREKGREPL